MNKSNAAAAANVPAQAAPACGGAATNAMPRAGG